MSKKFEFEEELKQLLRISKSIENIDNDKPLFGVEYGFSSGDLLIVFMELKEKYNIDLNKFIDKVEDYTVNNIADVLCELVVV